MARPKNLKLKNPDANARLRASDALTYFIKGYGYQEIANKAGYASAGAAHNAVQRELSHLNNPKAEEGRKIEVERLNRLQAALWDKAVSDTDAAAWASARVLNIIEQRSKLLGLYPTPEDAGDKGIIREYIGLDLSRVIGSNGHAQTAIPEQGSRN